MQYQKLTAEQKRVRKWRMKRNKLVCQLMDKDKTITSADALRQASKMMRLSGRQQ